MGQDHFIFFMNSFVQYNARQNESRRDINFKEKNREMKKKYVNSSNSNPTRILENLDHILVLVLGGNFLLFTNIITLI